MGLIRVTRVGDSGLSVGEDGSVRASTVYRVEFDSPLNDGTDAVLALSVRRGDTYVTPNGLVIGTCLCESADARKEAVDQSYAFLVTVGFSSRLWDEYARAVASGGTPPIGDPKPGTGGPGGEGNEGPLNPVNRPALLRYQHVKQKVPFFQDRGEPTSKPLLNSAGERFDPPYETDETWIALTIERNERFETFDSARARFLWGFHDTINEKTFLFFDKLTCRCEGIDIEAGYEPPFRFWKVTYSFVARPARTDENGTVIQAWDLRLLDQGANCFDAAGNLRACVDKHHIPTGVVPLDGTGKQLSDAARAARQFKYLTFTEFPTKNYDELGLP